VLERAQQFVFLLRSTGSYAISSPDKYHPLELIGAEDCLPRGIEGLDVQVRRLEPAALAAYAQQVTVIEANFLGPIFAGLEVTLRCGEWTVVNDDIITALAWTAWICGGPVIRTEDGAVRQSIDLVRFDAEKLCSSPCFGQDILLRLPHCELYEAHVRAAVQATLEQAGVRISYMYSTGRKDHVKLCFERYPHGVRTSLWRAMFEHTPTSAERLRGHEFRAVAYVKQLVDDRGFWADCV
jgi:hypothetical protein